VAKRTSRTTRSRGPSVHVILSAVALGMAVASLLLGILGIIRPETNVLLLGVGLFALALDRFA